VQSLEAGTHRSLTSVRPGLVVGGARVPNEDVSGDVGGGKLLAVPTSSNRQHRRAVIGKRQRLGPGKGLPDFHRAVAAAREPLHETVQVAVVLRPKHKMPMISQETIAQDSHRSLFQSLCGFDLHSRTNVRTMGKP